MRDWIKRHPKLTAAIGTAALAAGAYYGVPPQYTEQVLGFLSKIIGG